MIQTHQMTQTELQPNFIITRDLSKERRISNKLLNLMTYNAVNKILWQLIKQMCYQINQSQATHFSFMVVGRLITLRQRAFIPAGGSSWLYLQAQIVGCSLLSSQERSKEAFPREIFLFIDGKGLIIRGSAPKTPVFWQLKMPLLM